MAKELFLNTSRACFLCFCFREPLSDTENLMSEVSLRQICRYLNISQSSIFRKVLKRNLLEEEKEPQFLNEKCEFSVTMCSNCSSLTNKLTQLINQIEMINNLLAYQLQIFHLTINGRAQDGNRDDFRTRTVNCGSSSEMEISLVETLRAGIDKKCSQKVKHILASNPPKVLLEPLKLKTSNQQKTMNENVDLIETGISPPTRNYVTSIPSSPTSLQDPLSSPPQNHHLANLESESEILADPLTDQVIPPNSRSIRLRVKSDQQMIEETCKKYSKTLQSKIHCSLCSYSNGDCSKMKMRMRHHLLAVHPEILFTSQRRLHSDNIVSFNDRCRRLLSNESYHAKQRGGPKSNGKPSYQCEFCERKFKKHSDFKYHLLMTHFKIIEGKLSADSRKVKDARTSNLESIKQEITLSSSVKTVDSIETGDLEPKSEILLDPLADQVTPPNSQSTFHKRTVKELCEKYSKIVQNKIHCSLCPYSHGNCSKMKMRLHLVGVHPEILFTSQRRLHMGNNVSFKDRCKRLLSNEIDQAKQRGRKISNGERCYQCEFCERKFKRHYPFKHHLLIKHFKAMEAKLSGDSGKAKDILASNLESTNQEKTLSSFVKNADSIEIGLALAPPTGSDDSSILSPPTLLQDLLSSPETQILLNPLADQNISQNSQSIRLEAKSHRRIVLDTCRKYSKILQNKLHCSLCTYSNETCSSEKMRLHLMSKHPEILFTSQRLLYRDTKISFSDHCKRLLSIESSQAGERGKSISNGEPCYQCEFCERKFKGHFGFKYHLLMYHFKIMEAKLTTGSRKMNDLPKMAEPESETLLDPLADQAIPQNSQSIRTETMSHKRIVLDTCKKYSKIVHGKMHCTLCCYFNGSCDTTKMRLHLVGVHPEILFTSQKLLYMDTKMSFNDRCKRLLSFETFQAKRRGGSVPKKPTYQCEFCERKFKKHFDFKYHLLMNHFEIMEGKLSGGNFEISLEETQRQIILQSQQPVADDRETFIVPDVVVGERIKSGKQITKRIAFQKRKSYVCSKEYGGCGKFYANRYTLMNHKMKHCRSIGMRERWTCEFLGGGCGQVFTTKYILQNHQQRHCSRKNKSVAERKMELTGTDDNLKVSLECSVEDVVMSKVEVFDDGLDT